MRAELSLLFDDLEMPSAVCSILSPLSFTSNRIDVLRDGLNADRR